MSQATKMVLSQFLYLCSVWQPLLLMPSLSLVPVLSVVPAVIPPFVSAAEASLLYARK